MLLRLRDYVFARLHLGSIKGYVGHTCRRFHLSDNLNGIKKL